MSDDFAYYDFSSTSGLTLYNGMTVVSDWLKLADVDLDYDVNSAFRTVAEYFDEDWTMAFRVEVGPENNGYNVGVEPTQADGWAIVWAPDPTYIGNVGGAVGYFDGTGEAETFGLAFRLYTYDDIVWSVGGDITDQRTGKDWRGDFYYWLEYDSDALELRVYYSSTDTQPADPDETFTDVDFGSGPLHLGITSATGAAAMNAYLKSWETEPSAGHGWGLLL